jgi:hypothetical protein
MISSFIIHYFGWQARSRSGGIVRDGDYLLKRITDMRPMTFLDPGAFLGTNATDEPITSGFP